MDSLNLLVECHRRGYLSKEAADNVAAIRERLIADAFKKQAQLFVADLESGIFSKVAAIPGGSLLTKMRGGATKFLGSDDPWATAIKRFGLIMAGSAGFGAGAVGVQSVIDKKNRKEMRKRIEQSYPKMFKLEPDLNEHDKALVSRNFQVLASYAPSLAANPVVAATWSLEKAKRGRIEPIEIKSLAETQFAIDRSASREHFMASPATKNVMGLATAAMPKI